MKLKSVYQWIPTNYKLPADVTSFLTDSAYGGNSIWDIVKIVGTSIVVPNPLVEKIALEERASNDSKFYNFTGINKS